MANGFDTLNRALARGLVERRDDDDEELVRRAVQEGRATEQEARQFPASIAAKERQRQEQQPTRATLPSTEAAAAQRPAERRGERRDAVRQAIDTGIQQAKDFRFPGALPPEQIRENVERVRRLPGEIRRRGQSILERLPGVRIDPRPVRERLPEAAATVGLGVTQAVLPALENPALQAIDPTPFIPATRKALQKAEQSLEERTAGFAERAPGEFLALTAAGGVAIPGGPPGTGAAARQGAKTAGKVAQTELFPALAQAAARDPFFDRFMRGYRSLKLFDPLSRMRDLAGDNVVMATLEGVKDIPAAGADALIQGIGKMIGRGGTRLGGRVEGLGGVLPGGVRQQARGLREGAGQLRREFSPENIRRIPQQGGRYVEGFDPGAEVAIWQALPFKMAAASDVLGRPVAAGRTAYNMARAQAIREGKKGAERTARINQLLENPTPEMAQNMERQSELAVFMAESEATKKWRNFVADGKARYLQLIEPFSRSALNVAERAFDYSPASWARVLWRARNFIQTARNNPGVTAAEQEILRDARRRVTEQAGRATTGTVSLLAGWALADQINPWYERGTTEQRRRTQAGEPSAAIRAGNTWVPLQRNFGPAGPMVLVGAQLRELAREEAADAGEDARDWALAEHENALAAAVERYGADLLDLTRMSLSPEGALAIGQAMFELAPGRNLLELREAIRQGPAGLEATGRLAERQVGGGPIPGAFYRGTRAFDPYQREASGAIEQLQSQVPFLSRTLEPRLDPFGQPIPRRGAGLHALSPFATSRSRLPDDEFLAELDRVGYAVPALQRRKDEQGTEESDEVYRARVEEVGPLLRQVTEATLASPEYRQFSPEVIAQAVEERGLDPAKAARLAELAGEQQREALSKAMSGARRRITELTKTPAYQELEEGNLRQVAQERGLDPAKTDRLLQLAREERQRLVRQAIGVDESSAQETPGESQ